MPAKSTSRLGLTGMWRVWVWRVSGLVFAGYSAREWWELYALRFLDPNVVVFDGPDPNLAAFLGLVAVVCLWIAHRARKNVDDDRPVTRILE
jgi:hypothetical protein